MNGIARDFILTGLKLHDGVTYYITLVSCNGAQLCSSSTSSGILVDSSPPNRGIHPTVQFPSFGYNGFKVAHFDIAIKSVFVSKFYFGECKKHQFPPGKMTHWQN